MTHHRPDSHLLEQLLLHRREAHHLKELVRLKISQQHLNLRLLPLARAHAQACQGLGLQP